MKLKHFTILFAILQFHISFTQNNSTLQLSEIMKGEEFVGSLPSGVYWDEYSENIYFRWNPEQKLVSDLYRVNVDAGNPELVSLEERKAMPSYRGDIYNGKRNKRIFTKNGDLFLQDITKKEILQITNTLSNEYSPSFSLDESKIFYVNDNNVYSWDIESGATIQLTDFKKGKDRNRDKKLNDQQEWLRDDQLEHFDILKLQKETRDLSDSIRDSQEVERPLSIFYGEANISQINISPDGRYVTYMLSEGGSSSTGTKVPDYVTEDGYIEELRSRPKVGSPEPTYSRNIYDTKRDTFYSIQADNLDGIREKPEFMSLYVEKDSTFNPEFKKDRPVYITEPYFNMAGNKAVVVVRSMDHKDRWIALLDMESGTLNLLDRQHDEAWIGGPGIGGWGFSAGNIGWLKDDVSIWFQSEESGYAHLYSLNTETGNKKALTSGNFEILSAELSHDKSTFYFTSNEVSPAEQHFYSMSADGGKRTRITMLEGNNTVTISPDESKLAILYSYSNKPWELYVQDNTPEAEPKRITSSTTEAFNSYSWREPELISFKASDGVEVPARLYRAKGGSNGKPAVIFVHGAGYLQNVHKWWSSYYREYMFHNFLADNGYTVLDIDYRASAGYGRDWRTAIYRHMGGKDLSDQVDGAKYLVESLGVDEANIGIYGGSYGGFITIFAMFNHGDVFKCGAALRSVTDWAHYNHGYTSNILNTPVEDPKAFYQSSPIYFAENFNQVKLLMLHGVVDTNVQFQDVVRLSQRLIELGKTNWDLAIFPKEGHGFQYASSWTDEYRRIFALFEENLK